MKSKYRWRGGVGVGRGGELGWVGEGSGLKSGGFERAYFLIGSLIKFSNLDHGLLK